MASIEYRNLTHFQSASVIMANHSSWNNLFRNCLKANGVAVGIRVKSTKYYWSFQGFLFLFLILTLINKLVRASEVCRHPSALIQHESSLKSCTDIYQTRKIHVKKWLPHATKIKCNGGSPSSTQIRIIDVKIDNFISYYPYDAREGRIGRCR